MKTSRTFLRTHHLYGRAVVLFALSSLLSAGSAYAQAVALSWDIDETQSTLDLAFPDQTATYNGITATVEIRNQNGGNAGPWNVGNSAAVDGTIATSYLDGVSIEFLPGMSSAVGVASGSYRPNPAVFDPMDTDMLNVDGQYQDTSTGSGVYGARLQVEVAPIQVDGGYINFIDTEYDFASPMMTAQPLTGFSFDSDTITMGFLSATLGFDGVDGGFGQQLPDQAPTVSPAVLGVNTAAGGTVTLPDLINQPLLRKLTIPVDLPLQFDFSGNLLDSSVSGEIVAYATIPAPEPGVATMAVAGAAWLGLLARRRRGRAAA